jgi:hypothetical protein
MTRQVGRKTAPRALASRLEAAEGRGRKADELVYQTLGKPKTVTMLGHAGLHLGTTNVSRMLTDESRPRQQPLAVSM